MLGFITLTTLFVSFALGMPIAFTLLVTGFVLFIVYGFGAIPLVAVPQNLVAGVNSFTLLAVPLFILAGKVMNEGKITNKIFTFASMVVGHIRGGLAHVNVLASLLFAGMSGSAIADASGLGEIEINAMKEKGYDSVFSATITAASSTIGPIFPPSVPLVVYGGLAGVSVGRLLLGGIVPGIMMALFLMVTSYVYAVKRDYPREPLPTWKQFWKGFIDAFFPLVTPGIVLASIMFGIATPTEAAAVAALYSIILALVSKTIKLRDLPRIFKEVGIEAGILMFIVAAVSVFSWIITYHMLPHQLIQFLLSFTESRVTIILVTIFILFIIGLFMNPTPGLVLSLPFLVPLAQGLGCNMVQFGIMTVITLTIGLLTPPVGVCTYISARVAKAPVGKVVVNLIPFICVLVLVVLLVAFIPSLTTFIPNVILGKS